MKFIKISLFSLVAVLLVCGIVFAADSVYSSGNFNGGAGSCVISPDGSDCIVPTYVSWHYSAPAGVYHTMRISLDGVKDYTVLDNQYINKYNELININISNGSHTLSFIDRYYDTDHVIATRSVTGSCSPDSGWNGTSCIKPEGTLTSSGCSIVEGATTCNATIDWTMTKKIVDSSSVTTNYPSDNTNVTTSSSSSGSSTYAVPKSGASFYLYNGGKLVSSISINPIQGEFNDGQSYCIVGAMQSNCSPHFAWSSSGTSNPTVTANINGSSTTIAQNASMEFSDTNRPISYGNSRSYYFYNNGTQLDSVTLTPVCSLYTTWNGAVCSPVKLSATDCSISSGGFSCDSTWSATWNYDFQTSGLGVSHSSYLRNNNFTIKRVDPSGSKTTIYTQPSGETVTLNRSLSNTLTPPGTYQYELWFGGKLIETVSSVASCASGSNWISSLVAGGGPRCLPASLNISPTPKEGCYIQNGASLCDFSLSWNLPNITDNVASDKVWTAKIMKTDVNNSLYTAIDSPYLYNNPSSSKIVSLPKGTTTYHLIDVNYNVHNSFTGYEVAKVTANAVCEFGYQHDGVKCSLPAGTFVVTSCDVPVGSDHCTANFSWNVRNSNPDSSIKTNKVYISNSMGTINRLSNEASGSVDFAMYYNKAGVERGTTVILSHANHLKNLITLASSGDSKYYASCVKGALWSEKQGKCIANPVPLSGYITASGCDISAGGSSCQFSLYYDSQQYVLDSNGVRTGQTITPVIPSTIEIYHDGSSIKDGDLDLHFGWTAGTEGDSDDGKVYYASGNPVYLFDKWESVFADGTYYDVPYFSLPYRSKYHYLSLRSPDPSISFSDDPTLYRNITFKLMGHYSVVSKGIYDVPDWRSRCSNEGGSWSETQPGDINSITGTCTYDVVLDQVTVNATCPMFASWDNNTNSCLYDCSFGKQYSGTPYMCRSICPSGSYMSSTTNKCETAALGLSLKNATTNVEIVTEKATFFKQVGTAVSQLFGLRNKEIIKPSTQVRIYWQADKGLDVNTLQCTMPDGTVIKNQPYGTYPSVGSLQPSSTTTYSVTCKDANTQ